MYLVYFVVLSCAVTGNVAKDEKTLHSHLTQNYNTDIRPVKVSTDVLPVSFDFILEEVNSLDVKEQMLDVGAFITLAWNDYNLAWDKSLYGGINETYINTDRVWRPDLSLHNRASLDDNPFEYAKNTKLAVKNDGNVTWVIYTSWKSSCSTDVTWWPADKHKCTMKFGSLANDERHLRLTRSLGLSRLDHDMAKKRMTEKLFDVDSGEWETLNISSYERNSKRPCGSANKCVFTTVDVEIVLDRMPLYYLLYIILPLCALILTFLLIFHLDIGQRASYGVGILLSISVYLMTISEYLPQKSDTAPFLGIVFAVHFFLLCLAVPVAEFTAHLAERSNPPPPAWCSKMLTWSMSSVCKEERQKLKNRGGSDGATKCATNLATIGDSTEDVIKDVAISEREYEYQTEWRKIGRSLDLFFSLGFLFLLVISPLIVAASL